ncbi:MAG: diacylglycerol/polyprenol kinase family protein [Chlorobiota bacterium]
MLYIFIPFAIAITLFDVLSQKIEAVNKLLMRFFGKMLRPHEIKGEGAFNGATWVIISAAICVILFPKIVMITGFTILIISDIFAALIGRKFGKRPLFDKSWEGTISFIISAIIIVYIYYSVFALPESYLVAGIVAAIVGGFVEAVSKVAKIDDNLSIPISVGIVMLIFEYFYSANGQSFLNLVN